MTGVVALGLYGVLTVARDNHSIEGTACEFIFISDDEGQTVEEAEEEEEEWFQSQALHEGVAGILAGETLARQQFVNLSTVVAAISEVRSFEDKNNQAFSSVSEFSSYQESSSHGVDPSTTTTNAARSHLGQARPNTKDFIVEIERRRYPISQCWSDSAKDQPVCELQLLKDVISTIESVEPVTDRDYLLPDLDMASDSVSLLSQDDFRNIDVQDVTVYHVFEANFSDFPGQPKKDGLGYMCMPSQSFSSAAGQVYIDLTVSWPNTTENIETISSRRLTRVQVLGLSIGTSIEGSLQIWVETEHSRKLQAWYQLRSSSDEYLEYWSDFQWLGNFTRFAIGYLETLIDIGNSGKKTRFQGTLRDFRYGFEQFLGSLPNVEAQDVQLRFGKSDYRQVFSVHSQFIWHIANGMAVQHSPIFLEVLCQSIRPHKWSTSDKTIVTPYVHECFLHIFGDFMKPVQPRTETREMSHIEIFPKHADIPVSCYTDVKPGDFVRFKPNEDPEDSWAKPASLTIVSKSRSKEGIYAQKNAQKLAGQLKPSGLPVKPQEFLDNSSPEDVSMDEYTDKAAHLDTPEPSDTPGTSYQDYMYITEILYKPTLQNPQRHVYRGLWCYLPGTWHTHLDTSFYKYKNEEIFLSDHCNCPENYVDHILAEFEDIECKVSVNLFSDTLSGNRFFCRFMYLHDEGNFETLAPDHLAMAGRQLPCGCMTRRMRKLDKIEDHCKLFCAEYAVGDPVLLDVAKIPTFKPQRGMLEPFIIESINKVEHTVTVLRLDRRVDVDSQCLPNELLVSNDKYELTIRNARKSIQRKFGLWYCDTNALPDQLQLNGSGEQFFIHSNSIDDCSADRMDKYSSSLPGNLQHVNFTSVRAPFKKLRGLDLFCGAGNLGEGIRDAGVVQYASIVDLFSEALHSYKANHVFQDGDDETYESDFYLGSVNRFLEADIRRGRCNIPNIDFIVAGSPCQGFSQANVNKDTDVSLRNCSLIASFASYLDFYRPKYALLENVTGLGDNVRLPNGRIINVHRQLLAMAVGLGYQVRTYVNHAWMHGSAQQRTRIFVVFAAAGLVLPTPPVQSHEHPAYHKKSEKLRGPHGDVYHNPMTDDDAPKAFRPRLLRDIWEDLPNIGAGHRICITHPEHHLAARVSYAERQISRLYGGFAPSLPTKVSHCYKNRGRSGYTNRYAKTASEMHELGAVPLGLAEANPVIFRQGSKAYGRTDPGRLLGTVLTRPFPRAKLGSPCIHYEQPRRYTILEAKRAQGFLDHDVLLGSTLYKMKQIGNSVSRHASYAIGLTIRQAMLQNYENERKAKTCSFDTVVNQVSTQSTRPFGRDSAIISSAEKSCTFTTPTDRSPKKRRIMDDSDDELAAEPILDQAQTTTNL